MSKIKIGLLSIIVASSLNAFDFDLPSINVGSGGGVSVDISEILGLPSGNILGDSVGPLKYSCKLNLPDGKFSFNLGDLVLDKLNKTLDFGILSCDIDVDMDKAVCKDQLWGKLQKKGYGLLGEGKNKAQGKVSEGKEWLKEHIFDWEVGEESAWGKGVKEAGEYCKEVDDRVEKEIENQRIETRKINNTFDEVIQYVFQGDQNAIRFLHKNSGFKNNEKVKSVIDSIKDSGRKPIENEVNAIRQAYSEFYQQELKELEKTSIEKSRIFANQSAKGGGFMSDLQGAEFEKQIETRQNEIQAQAKQKCSDQTGKKHSECIDRVKPIIEQQEYISGDLGKGLNNLKEQRKQAQETIMDLKLKAYPKKAVLSAEQISKSAMTQSDKARHLAELREHEAKEALEEIRINNQILFQDELGRLEFKHKTIITENFDINAALKETSDIINKAQESATKTVNAIIGNGSGGSGINIGF